MNQVSAEPVTGKNSWQAPVALTVVVGTILGTSWQTEGVLAAQRIMVDLVMPVGLAWMSALFVAVRSWKLSQHRLSMFAGILFLMISALFSPILSRRLFRSLEASAPAISPFDKGEDIYRAVVVLGGGASLGSDGQPQLGADGQRVAMAAQMWHANRVNAIICTGEDNFIPELDSAKPNPITDPDLWNPARQGVDILVSLGVPKDRLYRIKGINTAAEMKELSSFLKNPPEAFPPAGPIGLITSAFHIPRALRLAKREGLDLTPIPVSFRTGPEQSISTSDLIPTVNAGAQLSTYARERLARLVGR